MATNQAFEVPFAGKWKEFLERDDGEEIVPEPVGDEATKKIWTSQVMIPFSVRKNVYAFCGPYLDAEIYSKEITTTKKHAILRGLLSHFAGVLKTANYSIPINYLRGLFGTAGLW
jgi:hypothetical protein